MPEFRKVNSGDPLRIPAPTWNAVLETAAAHRQSGGARGPLLRSAQQHGGAILVQNKSGEDLDQFACVQLDKPITLPADNEHEFKQRVAMEVVKPDADALAWAILKEPLAKDANGLAVVSGAIMCQINLIKKDDDHVDSSDGKTIPDSGSSGRGEILWVDGGVGSATATGKQWALINLGGGGGSDQDWYRLVVKYSGTGGGGDGTTAAKWRYNWYEPSDTTFSAPVIKDTEPTYYRGVGPRLVARDGDPAIAYKDANGNWVGWFVIEPLDPNPCPEED